MSGLLVLPVPWLGSTSILGRGFLIHCSLCPLLLSFGLSFSKRYSFCLQLSSFLHLLPTCRTLEAQSLFSFWTVSVPFHPSWYKAFTFGHSVGILWLWMGSLHAPKVTSIILFETDPSILGWVSGCYGTQPLRFLETLYSSWEGLTKHSATSFWGLNKRSYR